MKLSVDQKWYQNAKQRPRVKPQAWQVLALGAGGGG